MRQEVRFKGSLTRENLTKFFHDYRRNEFDIIVRGQNLAGWSFQSELEHNQPNDMKDVDVGEDVLGTIHYKAAHVFDPKFGKELKVSGKNYPQQKSHRYWGQMADYLLNSVDPTDPLTPDDLLLVVYN